MRRSICFVFTVASVAAAGHGHDYLHKRAASPVVSTITSISTVSTIVRTQTTTVATTINSDIATIGPAILVPNVLTINFQQLPAYVYLETEVATIQTTTSYQLSTVRIITTIRSSNTGASKTSGLAGGSTGTSIATTPGVSTQKTASSSGTSAAPTTSAGLACMIEGVFNQTADNVALRSDDGDGFLGGISTNDANECWQFCTKQVSPRTCGHFIFDSTRASYNCVLYAGTKLTVPDGGSLVTPKSGTGYFLSNLYGSNGKACVRCPGCKYDLATSTFPADGWYATCTSVAAIATKTAVNDCNAQGIGSENMQEHVWATYVAKDAFSCQVACKTYNWNANACEAFSFQPSTKNCTLYTISNDLTANSKSGVYFSDIWPQDGSTYCYSQICK